MRNAISNLSGAHATCRMCFHACTYASGIWISMYVCKHAIKRNSTNISTCMHKCDAHQQMLHERQLLGLPRNTHQYILQNIKKTNTTQISKHVKNHVKYFKSIFKNNANIPGLAAVLDSSLDFAFPKHVVAIEEGSWKIPGRSLEESLKILEDFWKAFGTPIANSWENPGRLLEDSVKNLGNPEKPLDDSL